MKNLFLIILFSIIVIATTYILLRKKDVNLKNNNNDSCIIYIPEDISKKDVELYDRGLCALQLKYKVGYNGVYEPVPISQQPNQALPFNPGLQPCVNFIQRS